MRFINPLIIFLDEDLKKSSEMLSDKYLSLNISNCCQVLVCSLLYNVGIRNRKLCKFLFSKERKTESLQKYFPDWPMKNPPSFVKYNSPESKWCRKCKNHYDVILSYFENLLDEYGYRNGKDHEIYDMLDFLKMAQYHISLSLGIRVIYVKNLKIQLPWKNLPLKFRKKDIIRGYREYYKSLFYNPYSEYEYCKRDIPEFLLDGRNIDEFDPSIIDA